jgi:hypothetical protein
MFNGWFKKKLQAALREMNDSLPVREATSIERLLGGATPTIMAFKINNGFVVQTSDASAQYGEIRHTGFTFCQDAEAIAQHIVTSAMKEKLGVQQEMFGQSIPAMLQKNSVIGSAQTAVRRNP